MAASGSLLNRTVGAMFWSQVQTIGLSLLRLGSNLILSRIFFPEVYSLMALLAVVMEGLHLFSDVGIGPSIIQNPRGDDPKFLGTAYTFQMTRGIVLFLVACALAYPVAQIYSDRPGLIYLLPMTGIGAVIDGLRSTKDAQAKRHLKCFGRLAFNALIGRLAGLALTLGLAFAGMSDGLELAAIAFVLGGLLSAAVEVALSHVNLPGNNVWPTFDRECANALVTFGRWIFISTALTFLSGRADQLIFAKMIPKDLHGSYYLAVMLEGAVLGPLLHLAPVLMSAYSRAGEQGEEKLRSSYRRSRTATMALAGWALAGLIAGGDTIFRLLYDVRYESGGWMLQLLGLSGWFYLLEDTVGSVLLARGRADLVAAGSAMKVLGMLLFIPLGFHLLGFPGAVLALVVAELSRYIVSAWAGNRVRMRGIDQDMVFTAGLAVVSVVGYLCTQAVREAGAHVIIEAATTFVVVSVLWSPAFIWVWRSNSETIKSLLFRTKRERSAEI